MASGGEAKLGGSICIFVGSFSVLWLGLKARWASNHSAAQNELIIISSTNVETRLALLVA